VKPDNSKKTLQDVVAESRAIRQKAWMKKFSGQASDTAR